jgi:hypothetical protein
VRNPRQSAEGSSVERRPLEGLSLEVVSIGKASR